MFNDIEEKYVYVLCPLFYIWFLITISVAEIIWRGMLGFLGNNEVEGSCQGIIWSTALSGGTEEDHETPLSGRMSMTTEKKTN